MPTLAHPARTGHAQTREDVANHRAMLQVRLRCLDTARAVLPEDAPLIRAAARVDTAVLPRWHQEDRGLRNRHRGYHEPAPPGAYARIRAWNGRAHFLAVVVPTALATHPEAVAAAHVAPDTFRAWAEVESGYVQDMRTGRRLVVRPSTVAQVLGMAERTVQRCRALARQLGLLIDVMPGRMLTQDESFGCRRRGSRQRGLSTESALTIPSPIAAVVEHVTPTRGKAPWKRKVTLKGPTDSAASGAAGKEAATRPPRPPGRPRPAPVVTLARAVQHAIPWLSHEKIASLVPSLHRFATAQRPWTAADVIDGIDTITARRGWSAVRAERIRTRPAAVLAWYLRQLDPTDDHPGPSFPTTGRATWPTWCGTCDQHTRQRWIPAEQLAYRCPTCHPLAGQRSHRP